jgi:hypothetical protein
MVRANRAAIAGVMSQLGTNPNSSTRNSACLVSSGICATNSEARMTGKAAPVAGSIRLAIVPPVVMI